MNTTSRADRHRLIFFAGMAAALLLCLGPIYDPDLPWHIAAGRSILATHSIPRHDIFSWTLMGQPWMDFEWVSGLIFCVLDKVGGAVLLWLFKIAAFFSLTLMFTRLLRLWKLSDAWIGLAAPAFVAAIFPADGLRPEIFSALFFLLELHWLERRRLNQLPLSPVWSLAAHAVVYAAWANLHAGFVTGLMLCWCYGVGELIAKKPKRKPAIALALIVAFLATFANPYGYKLYSIIFDHWRHFDVLHHLIEEWKAPHFPASYLDGYWLLIVFSLIGFLILALQGMNMPAEHVVAVIVFGIFASRSIRTTTYAILLVYPLSLAAWHRLSIPSRWRQWMGVCAAIAIVFVAWRGMAWGGVRRFFSWPLSMTAQGPEEATRFLHDERLALAPLHLYNPYNWGGYFDYVLYPDYKVFVDGRYIFIDLLGEIAWAELDPSYWRGLMESKLIDVAVFENNGAMLRYPWDMGSRPYLDYSMPIQEWALVYWDSQSIIFVRRTKVPSMWLGAHEFRWIRPHGMREAGLYVVSGAASWKDMSAEIDRYIHQIGDPEQVAILEQWRTDFAKGLRPSERN